MHLIISSKGTELRFGKDNAGEMFSLLRAAGICVENLTLELGADSRPKLTIASLPRELTVKLPPQVVASAVRQLISATHGYDPVALLEATQAQHKEAVELIGRIENLLLEVNDDIPDGFRISTIKNFIENYKTAKAKARKGESVGVCHSGPAEPEPEPEPKSHATPVAEAMEVMSALREQRAADVPSFLGLKKEDEPVIRELKALERPSYSRILRDIPGHLLATKLAAIRAAEPVQPEEQGGDRDARFPIETLAEDQADLDPEAAKILRDNLHDLYIGDPTPAEPAEPAEELNGLTIAKARELLGTQGKHPTVYRGCGWFLLSVIENIGEMMGTIPEGVNVEASKDDVPEVHWSAFRAILDSIARIIGVTPSKDVPYATLPGLIEQKLKGLHEALHSEMRNTVNYNFSLQERITPAPDNLDEVGKILHWAHRHIAIIGGKPVAIVRRTDVPRLVERIRQMEKLLVENGVVIV